MSTTITPTTTPTASATDPTALVPSTGSQTLSQNDFLNLLVAQMKSQDPMNPQSDTQMAAQMAQFTSLQQSSTMSTNIATMLTQQQIMQANSMLGGTVTLQVDANTTAKGVVQAVQLIGGAPKILVNNTTYDLSQVLSLSPTDMTAATTATTAATVAAADSTLPPTDRGSAAP